MAQQKLLDLSEAASQLGIGQDQLTQLREQGKLRGYRDGASWKFRVEEIEKLAAEGLQKASQHVGSDEPLNVDFGDLGVVSGDDPAASDISLDGLDDPTVPAELADSEIADGGLESSEIELVGDDDDADSVLLSETEFGDSENRPPSTIIGKVDLDQGGDMDLNLEFDEDEARESDVRLATDSDVLSSETPSEVTSSDPDTSKSKFEQIEELEIDLEAESSRILSPDNVVQAQQGAEAEAADGSSAQVTDSSDLDLPGFGESHPVGGISSVNIDGGSEKGSEAGLSGISQLHVGDESELGGAGLTGLSKLELEPDDEDVLSEGSDITLSSQDSGINLISPSDSGLALDDGPIDLGGSAVGSGLDIGDDDIALAASDGNAGGDVFSLTADIDSIDSGDDSSSQIIALDEVVDSEEMAAGAAVFDDDVMLSVEDDERGLDDGMGTPVLPATEASFSLGSVLGLTGCIVLLCLAGIMMFDLVRNIWSWNKTYSLNSSLIDSILSLFPS